MEVMLIASSAVLALTTLFAITRQLHMLQLNSYYVSRYYGWLKGAFTVRTVFSALVCALTVAAVIFGWSGIFILCLAVVSAAVRVMLTVSDYRTSIKKIVFTSRVKRLYATSAVLLAAAFVFGLFFNRAGLIVLSLFSFATPVLVIFARFINAPAEKAISDYFVRDAKRILKEHTGLKIIGVTGSYGKTSTKHAVGRMLSEKYNVLITPGSFNTPMGVVRTVREQLTPATQVFVVEMGAKNVGDINEICEIADPEAGIITSVGPQHLDTFGSVENVLKTKFELADWVGKKNGKVFLNTDNNYIAGKAGEYGGAISYGTRPAADYHAENVIYSRRGSTFDIVAGERRIPVSTRMLGGHNVQNIVAAAAVGAEFGLSDSQIRYAVASLKPVSHRLELKSFIGGSVLIDDAYNANPEGCLEAVRVLSHFDGMKKVIVTPGLVELGSKEYECNYNLGLAAAEVCDVIILVGEKRAVPMAKAAEDFGFSRENLHIVKSFSDAMSLMQGFVGRDCAVLFENDLPDNYAG